MKETKGITLSDVRAVYSGPEGTFLIVAWTGRDLFDAAAPDIEAVARSFKFPP